MANYAELGLRNPAFEYSGAIERGRKHWNFPPPETRRGLPPGELNTAGHEALHAFVGDSLPGLTLIGISMERSGNVLASTHFAGTDPDAFAAAAVAGSFATHDGTAHGYGSDLMKANMVGSISTAENVAASIIAGFPKDVQRKVSEMILLNKGATASEFRTMIRQAYEELKEDNIDIDQLLIEQALTVSEEKSVLNRAAEARTIMESHNDNTVHIIQILDGQKSESIYCNECKVTNGHVITCTNYKQEGSVLGKRGDIFIGTYLKPHSLNPKRISNN